jgi:hypothetical protein
VRPGPPLLAATTIVVGTALAAHPAQASGSLEVTGAATAANGYAARVFARGAEATYYNPALLPEAAAATSVGFFVLASHESVLLAPRPPGVDVPAAVYNAQLRNPDGTTTRLVNRPLATADIPVSRADTDETEARGYLSLGLVRPLLDDKLVLGFYGVLPLTTFQAQQAFFADEREQFFGNRLRFELLGDRLVQSSFALALASRPARWLSLGAGVDITFGTVARAAVHVPDAGDQREILLNPDVEVTSSFAPYLAVLGAPSRSLRVTTTLHLPVSADTDGENRVRFWNYAYPEGEDSVRQVFAQSLAYEPLRIGMGARWTVRESSDAGPGLDVGVQAVIAHWSSYLDRHAEEPPTPFDNTVSPTLGAALDWSGRRLAVDLAFSPSPVPPQDGRTNYVDGHRIGADVAFESPFDLFGKRMRACLRGFAQVFLTREETKRDDARHPVVDELPDGATDIVTDEPIEAARGLQTNNPGYPGYTSSAWIVGGGLSIEIPDR